MPAVSFIQMVGVAMMAWSTLDIKRISGLTMVEMSSPKAAATSMVSSPFGHMPNDG